MLVVAFYLLITLIAVATIFLAIQGFKIVFLRRKLGEAIVGTEKKNIQLSYLVKTADRLSSALNKEKLLRLIIETFGEFTKSERTLSVCALYLIDYNVNRYVYETGFNMDVTMLAKTSFSLEDPPFKALQKTREISFLDETQQIKNTFFKNQKLHMLHDVECCILVPLIIENEIMGIALAFLAKSSFDFLRKEIFLLKAMVAQAAIALGSAVQSELAVLDRLTKVYNHAYFEGRLEQEVARSDRYKYPVALLMIDIDYFKRINDTYGHQYGDIILKEVARVIKSNIRTVDLCARYGGEEFAVILPETDLMGISSRSDGGEESSQMGGAVSRAEALRKHIENMEIVSSEGPRVNLTVSIGIGIKRFPEGTDVNKSQLIKQADKNLYLAKQQGRNRVCHT